MFKIKPSAKFSLERFIDKGSYQARLEHAQKLNAQFYQAVQSKMFEEMLPVKEYKKTLQNILPANIKFNFKTYVKKFLGQDDAYVAVLTNKYDEIDSFEIRVPSRKTAEGEKVVAKRDDYLSMHETFHLFAALSNPKHTARSIFNDTEYKFYEKFIYTRMYSDFKLKEKIKWAKTLRGFLKHRDLDKQIYFLQNCRYRLTEEKLAYKEGEKYGKNNCMSQMFYFDEKINIIEKLLYKTLKKARKENKINKSS